MTIHAMPEVLPAIVTIGTCIIFASVHAMGVLPTVVTSTVVTRETAAIRAAVDTGLCIATSVVTSCRYVQGIVQRD